MLKNILLNPFEAPFQCPPFDKITEDCYLPALAEAIKIAKENIALIKKESHPTFTSVIEKLEFSSATLSKVSKIFYNLLSANINPTLQHIAKNFSTQIAAYSNTISKN